MDRTVITGKKSSTNTNFDIDYLHYLYISNDRITNLAGRHKEIQDNAMYVQRLRCDRGSIVAVGKTKKYYRILVCVCSLGFQP